MSHVRFHEAECLDSQSDHLWGFDDFWGDSLDARWRLTGSGGGIGAVLDSQDGGVYRLSTGATNGNWSGFDWSDLRTLHVNKNICAEYRVKLLQLENNWLEITLRYDSNNRIFFRYNTGVGDTNWMVSTVNGGAQTVADSGVAIDTDYHIFRIECHTHGGSHVHFYIDGVECGNSPITTNVPSDAADYLAPYIILITNENAAKYAYIDYIAWRQNI